MVLALLALTEGKFLSQSTAKDLDKSIFESLNVCVKQVILNNYLIYCYR